MTRFNYCQQVNTNCSKHFKNVANPAAPISFYIPRSETHQWRFFCQLNDEFSNPRIFLEIYSLDRRARRIISFEHTQIYLFCKKKRISLSRCSRVRFLFINRHTVKKRSAVVLDVDIDALCIRQIYA